MTFDKEHEMLLAQLDHCYKRIREVHADTTWLNKDNSEFQELLSNFEKLQQDIFRFKIIKLTMERWRKRARPARLGVTFKQSL